MTIPKHQQNLDKDKEWEDADLLRHMYLLQLINDVCPDYTICAWDLQGRVVCHWKYEHTLV